VIGHPFLRLVQPDDHDLALAVHEATLNGHSGTTAFRAVGLKGTQRWLETRVAPLRLPGSNEVSVLSVTQDITERIAARTALEHLNAQLEERVRQRTAQLEVLNRELAAFSYTVSHDLRLPISGVTGFCHLLEKEVSAHVSERGRHLLGRIRASAGQMTDMIEGLLQLSQLGQVAPQVSRVDLSDMALQILEGLAAGATDRQVDLTVQPGLTAVGDQRLLRQVLSNLLGNAWKFTARQTVSRISVGAEIDPQGHMVFFVRDNGAGFDMRKADKLFAAFQRLHAAAEFSGSGIGLATVHRIIKHHRGHIWAQSAVNEGATFYFTLGDQAVATGSAVAWA
jgi:light-regulated signal transduction histidine kinase (bacteriophytochrome)